MIEVEDVSHEISEPAGLCGLRKQVTEAKVEPLELRKRKDRKNVSWEQRGWGKAHVRERERGRKRGRGREKEGVLSPMS